jgi:hypothetical protein
MVAPRYPGTSIRTARKHLFVMEGVLALSVIAGLGFVTVRVMNMGPTASMTQVVVKTDALPLSPNASDTKTP